MVAGGLALISMSSRVARAQFTQSGRVAADMELPKVVSSTPRNGEDGVSPDLVELRIVFSASMDRYGMTVAAKEGFDFPASGQEPNFVDDRTVVIPVSLLPQRTYAVRLNTETEKGFRDAQGRELAPFVLTFKTR
jgi:hypothetical protein